MGFGDPLLFTADNQLFIVTVLGVKGKSSERYAIMISDWLVIPFML